MKSFQLSKERKAKPYTEVAKTYSNKSSNHETVKRKETHASFAVTLKTAKVRAVMSVSALLRWKRC